MVLNIATIGLPYICESRVDWLKFEDLSNRDQIAISHKPNCTFTSRGCWSVCRELDLVKLSRSTSGKTCYWVVCTMRLLPRRETLHFRMLRQPLARSVANNPNVLKLDVLVRCLKLTFYFFMYWTNVTRIKAVIGYWEWRVCHNLNEVRTSMKIPRKYIQF